MPGGHGVDRQRVGRGTAVGQVPPAGPADDAPGPVRGESADPVLETGGCGRSAAQVTSTVPSGARVGPHVARARGRPPRSASAGDRRSGPAGTSARPARRRPRTRADAGPGCRAAVGDAGAARPPDRPPGAVAVETADPVDALSGDGEGAQDTVTDPSASRAADTAPGGRQRDGRQRRQRRRDARGRRRGRPAAGRGRRRLRACEGLRDAGGPPPRPRRGPGPAGRRARRRPGPGTSAAVRVELLQMLGGLGVAAPVEGGAGAAPAQPRLGQHCGDLVRRGRDRRLPLRHRGPPGVLDEPLRLDRTPGPQRRPGRPQRRLPGTSRRDGPVGACRSVRPVTRPPGARPRARARRGESAPPRERAACRVGGVHGDAPSSAATSASTRRDRAGSRPSAAASSTRCAWSAAVSRSSTSTAAPHPRPQLARRRRRRRCPGTRRASRAPTRAGRRRAPAARRRRSGRGPTAALGAGPPGGRRAR